MKINITGKILYIFLLLLIFNPIIKANNIKTNIVFEPEFVQIGDEFELVITLSSFDKKIEVNNIPKLNNIIKSNLIEVDQNSPQLFKSNTFVFNGKVILKRYTVKIKYKLKALKSGKLDLPSLIIKVNKEPIIIKSISINISDKIQKKAEILNSFINVEKDKDTLYPGQTVTLKYYLYTIYNILEYKINDFKLPDNLFFSYENIDTKIEQLFLEEHIYNKINILNLRLTFNKNGNYVIPELKLFAKIRETVGIKNVISELDIKSDKIKINVIDFPEKPPEKFIGLVGTYNFNYKYKLLENKKNSFIKISFKIHGIGNLNSLLFSNIITSNSYFNIIGPNRFYNKDSIELIYFAIPKFSGKAFLPSIEFYYFNTSTNSFEKVYIPEEQIYIKKVFIKTNENKVKTFKLEPKKIVKNTNIYKYNQYLLNIFLIGLFPLILIPFYLFIVLYIRRLKEKKIKQKKYFRSYYGLWLAFIENVQKNYSLNLIGKNDDEFFKNISDIFTLKEIEFLKNVKKNLNYLFIKEKENINFRILKKFKKWSKKII